MLDLVGGRSGEKPVAVIPGTARLPLSWAPSSEPTS